MRVLITPRSFGKTDAYAFQLLEEAGFEIVKNNTGGILTEKQLSELIGGCDGVILGVDPLTSTVLDKAPNLKAVAKYGVGVDNIDLAACEARGITVSRTVGANAEAVADYTFAMMMAAARKIIPIDGACRKSDWSKAVTVDVYGKTLGLIGLGAIGKGVAARAKGFGMRILASDLFWDFNYAKSMGIQRTRPEQIYAEADFISVHTPLTNKTKGMIGKAQIEMMKSTAIIINTARGGIIDEDALLEALRNERIYGAGIDAFEQEPPTNTAWFELPNVVLGSHSAASTIGATEQMGRMAAKNLIRDLDILREADLA
ncbi:MAG: phosphoglycerate dehydrogenase [Defluviitaleaceae bacterium]|nr:phosphoglycerate dehydrogenase [Defluviitaleaceae bacterium]MCL2837102.1 phosphoglycerate dehydrogenase [Defluviitaleaceae bacterium]